MLKRLIVSFLVVGLLATAPLMQAQKSPLRRSSFKIPGIFIAAGMGLASIFAYSDLYKQKNRECSELIHTPISFNTSKPSMTVQQIENWLDQRIEQIQKAGYPEEETRSLVKLITDLRIILQQNVYGSPTKEPLKKQFSSLIRPFSRQIQKELDRSNKTATKDTKRIEILKKRQENFDNLLEWAQSTDASQVLLKLAKKKQERNNLWIFPVVLNGFVALAYGINYYLNSNSK